MKFTEDDINALIKGIEDGTYDEFNLPEGYYKAISDYFIGGLEKGFGKTVESLSREDDLLLREMATNVYHFSAAKTFNQTLAMTELLRESESSRDFNNKARELYDNWNDNYGRTEYTTARGSGDMAAKWVDIQTNKDIVPNLRYSAVGDACSICAPLDGLVAPIDDKVWDDIYPLNHYNCYCTVLQVDDDVTPNRNEIVDGVTDKMSNDFMNNVGKTGTVFGPDHEYFQQAKQYREYALRNFDLPMPEELNTEE